MAIAEFRKHESMAQLLQALRTKSLIHSAFTLLFFSGYALLVLKSVGGAMVGLFLFGIVFILEAFVSRIGIARARRQETKRNSGQK